MFYFIKKKNLPLLLHKIAAILKECFIQWKNLYLRQDQKVGPGNPIA